MSWGTSFSKIEKEILFDGKVRIRFINHVNIHTSDFSEHLMLTPSLGENCSTAEVESVISSVCGLKDAVVFGVQIPGAEGRAGMAVISDPENNLDLQQLVSGISKALPSYARPMFLRVSTSIDMTGILCLLIDYLFIAFYTIT